MVLRREAFESERDFLVHDVDVVREAVVADGRRQFAVVGEPQLLDVAPDGGFLGGETAEVHVPGRFRGGALRSTAVPGRVSPTT